VRFASPCLLFAAIAVALPPPPAFLLPGDIAPLRHTIELTIDPNKPTFDGWARIDVDLKKRASVIWVNGKDLTPVEASVTVEGRMIPARAENSGGEFIGLTLPAPVGPGPATISIRYRGRLDEKLVLGAYRRKVEGNWYVYTTFTPIEARRAFPCFDEPHFKTPWEFSIRVPTGNKAFSNAPETGETPEPDGQTLIRFAPTEPLPAEVVAFAVGPFDVYDGGRVGHGTPVRVITPKGHAAEGKSAADATAAVLPALEEYTGIPYPYQKLDHLAQADGAFGAVENPGLIIYLARELLVPPLEETAPRTRALHLLEAHEVGHQWFGDMVTQADWNDVWLSEGFATWISDKIVDQESPPARARLLSINDRDRIMTVDSSSRTRPVRVEIRSREASRDVYARIVYLKGSSLLLMLEGWLGEEKVHQAMRAYLAEHRFGNVTTGDLSNALKTATGVDPSQVMHSLLDSTGVPRVSADVECDGARRLRLRQATPATLPVCYRGDGISRSCAVLDGLSAEIDLPAGANCPAWIFLNDGGTGYYKTAFTNAQLTALPLDQLSPAERLTLTFDLRGVRLPAARALLMKLAVDAEPDIAAAANRVATGR
jgi:aminopeptidase N